MVLRDGPKLNPPKVGSLEAQVLIPLMRVLNIFPETPGGAGGGREGGGVRVFVYICVLVGGKEDRHGRMKRRIGRIYKEEEMMRRKEGE